EGMEGYDMSPAFSPDGKRLAWTSMEREGYEADKNNIFVMDRSNGRRAKMNVTAGWDGTVDGFEWDKSSTSIYFNAAWRGTKQLFEVAVPANLSVKMAPKVARITDGK